MRRYVLIIVLLYSAFMSAQQLTFRDLLAAEPEIKQSAPKKVAMEKDKVTKSTYSYSPLRSLSSTFFESYLCILGNVGGLSNGSSNNVYRICYGGGLEYEFGARFSPMFFVGAGIGARTYFPESMTNYGTLSSWGFNMPLYAAAKIYMLADYNFSMSTDFGFGGCLAIQQSSTTPHGIFLKVGFGADVKRFTIAAGYEMIAQISSGTMGHYGYLKFGVIISK